ncbi:hypothetical protein PF005_g24097 [Phytophthora fragariae]|uniref:Uncharacterized protein n=2 Tax=Phytophthora TaxID=4783 RepID=A0A6A3IFX0_9STRA|nr:hypothetical protein PF003_g845 [Phytophthora fragariae]KAE9040940.1 hypothetical protein PR002_g4709 [Phytophthora rubi]KAE8924860.1 hypothetical protein PF009_g24916 [Phytophthora fragariae]KAE8979405.1 hypothetical protein PF011_g22863 [Phytophthora fragariae]KAE9043171.1 hypothetical protein PR001_g5907 [Phytophthora rubi]
MLGRRTHRAMALIFGTVSTLLNTTTKSPNFRLANWLFKLSVCSEFKAVSHTGALNVLM